MAFVRRAICLSLLVLSASGIGVASVGTPITQATTAVAVSDPSVQSGVNTTAIAYGVNPGGTVTFQLDTDLDDTADYTWQATDEDSDGTIRTTFRPSNYKQGQGTYWVSVKGTTSSAFGEVDDTSPSTGLQVTNPSGRQLHLNITTWDTIGNNWENLATLNVSITGPSNATLTREDFNESATRGRNRTYYTTSVRLSTDGEYHIQITNATDQAGNTVSDSKLANESLIVDTDPPNVWNGSATDVTNGNNLVDNGDTIVVTANVSDDFLRDVWINASTFGAGNVSLTKANGTTDFYRANFTVDAENASADGKYKLHVWANDAGWNTNQTSTGWISLDTTEPTFTNQKPAPASYSNDSGGNVTAVIADRSPITGTVNITDRTGIRVNGTFENTTGVTLTANGTILINTSKAVAPDGFVDGPVTVNITATDAENHTNSTRWTFTVDTALPTIDNATVIDVRDGNSVVGDGHNITVAANVTDRHLDTDSIVVNASPFGAESIRMTPVAGSNRYAATFAVNASPNLTKTYTLPIHGTDLAGNTNTTSAGTILIDTVRPEAPTSIDGNPIHLGNADAYSLTVTLPPDHQNVTLQVRLSNGHQNTTVSAEVLSTVNTTGVTLDTRALPDGKINVTAKVTDPAGNSNLHGWVPLGTITKDTVRPRASAAHAIDGTRRILMPISEPLHTRNYTAADIEYTGSQTITGVTLSRDNLLVVSLGSPVTRDQLATQNATVGLDEDATDRVGNPGVVNGSVTLTPPHYFLGKVTYSDSSAGNGLTVTATYEGGIVATATTDQDGRYTLQVSDPDYTTSDETIRISVKDSLGRRQWVAGKTSTVDLTVSKPTPNPGGSVSQPISDLDPETTRTPTTTRAPTTTSTTTTSTLTTTQTTTQTPTQTVTTRTTVTTDRLTERKEQTPSRTTSTTEGVVKIEQGGSTGGIVALVFSILVILSVILGWRYWNNEEKPPRL